MAGRPGVRQLGEAPHRLGDLRPRGDRRPRHVLAAPARGSLQRRLGRRPGGWSLTNGDRAQLPACARSDHAGSGCRGPRPLVWMSVALCALVAVPGVVDQDDLDARWINALPVLGVVLALALTARAAWGRRVVFVRRARGDGLRLVLGAAVAAHSAMVAAEAGFYFPGDVFLGEEVPPMRRPGSRGRSSRLPSRHRRGAAGAHRAVALADSRRASAARLPLAHARLQARERAAGQAGTSNSGSEAPSTRSRACSVRISPGAGS